MIPKVDYGNKCWWCGGLADSAEHKYKKSDLLKEFGSGQYKDQDELVRVYKGELRKILGPKSQEVRFPNNICQTCNNDKSQPFDLAYSTFVNYLKNNEEEIYSAKQFQLSMIFGKDYEVKRVDVIRYYVKHICCRLASAGILIKDEIKDFLNGNMTLKFISLYMEIREDIVALIKRSEADGINAGSLWIGDLACILNEKAGYVRNVSSFHGYRWLRTNYIYDDEISILGTNFINDTVFLGSGYSISPGLIFNTK